MRTQLSHVQQQLAANHRAYTTLFGTFYMYSLHQHQHSYDPFPLMSLDEFRRFIAWLWYGPSTKRGEDVVGPEANVQPNGVSPSQAAEFE